MKLKELKSAIVDKALDVLARRFVRLDSRRIVLFPWLRYKMLLKKVKHLEEA